MYYLVDLMYYLLNDVHRLSKSYLKTKRVVKKWQGVVAKTL